MWRGIGFGLVLYFVSVFLTSSFNAFDRATTATFEAVEAAAIKSQERIDEL